MEHPGRGCDGANREGAEEGRCDLPGLLSNGSHRVELLVTKKAEIELLIPSSQRETDKTRQR